MNPGSIATLSSNVQNTEGSPNKKRDNEMHIRWVKQREVAQLPQVKGTKSTWKPTRPTTTQTKLLPRMRPKCYRPKSTCSKSKMLHHSSHPWPTRIRTPAPKCRLQPYRNSRSQQAQVKAMRSRKRRKLETKMRQQIHRRKMEMQMSSKTSCISTKRVLT